MLDNTKLTYAQADVAGNTIEMTYYADRDGTTQVNAGDSSTRVRSFSIHVKAGDGQNPVRRDVYKRQVLRRSAGSAKRSTRPSCSICRTVREMAGSG